MPDRAADVANIVGPRLASRLVAAAVIALVSAVADGQVAIVERITVTGTVEAVAGPRVTIRTDSGDRHEIRVQRSDDPGVPLADGRLLAFPAEVRITGRVDPAKIPAGQVVRFRTRLSDQGAAAGDATGITLVDADTAEVGVAWPHGPPGPTETADCMITAGVLRASARRLAVELPPGRPFARKTVVACRLPDDAVATLESHDLARLAPGATLTGLDAVRLDTGDLVARRVVADNPAAGRVATPGDDRLENKHRSLSDAPPSGPRLVRSPHFAFMTDLSDRDWAVIRDKLERMVGLLERFFGRQSAGVVEGFIVRDLSRWPSGLLTEPLGVAKIRRREGVCFNTTLGPRRRAELYACDDHGVIQHECVHGFCHLTFGSTGPTWLSEGVAELGNHWRDGDTAVEIDSRVMGYLQNALPKRTLAEITAPGRQAAGSWQDYAWRWALCHLLAYNPNYADRFRPLAVALMEERPGVSFDSVYGPVAREIAFEYELFLATLGNGSRADLVAWPWKARARPLAAGNEATATVKAAAGWQAAGIAVEAAVTYAIEATGTWRIAPAGLPCDADGDAGRGRLVGVVFHDHALTPPISLGVRAEFTAPIDGTLFLRCDDDWTQLADNEDAIRVVIRRR